MSELYDKLAAQYAASVRSRQPLLKLPAIPLPVAVVLGIGAWILPVWAANSYVTYHTGIMKQVIAPCRNQSNHNLAIIGESILLEMHTMCSIQPVGCFQHFPIKSHQRYDGLLSSRLCILYVHIVKCVDGIVIARKLGSCMEV